MEDNINKYFDAIDIIYWINLDRADIRRKNMMEMLEHLPVKNERISAVDGKKISTQELLTFFIKKENIETQLNNYEYACLLSHLNTINKFSKTDYKYALILEDDTTLEYVKYWNKKISGIINEAPNDWEIIMLNYIYHVPIQNLYEVNNNIASTQAYIINNTAAKQFINKYYINYKYDLTSFDTYNADFFLFNRLKTYCYKYPYFTYSIDNDSFIHTDHLNMHKLAKDNAFIPWKELQELQELQENKTNTNNERINKNNNLLIIGISIIIFLVIITLVLHLNYRI